MEHNQFRIVGEAGWGDIWRRRIEILDPDPSNMVLWNLGYALSRGLRRLPEVSRGFRIRLSLIELTEPIKASLISNGQLCCGSRGSKSGMCE